MLVEPILVDNLCVFFGEGMKKYPHRNKKLFEFYFHKIGYASE